MEKLLRVFDALMECKTVNQVDSLLVDHKVDERFYFSEKVYPRLPFRISKEEIIELKQNGLLAADNTIQDVTELSALEKLLYSIIWKNGDLQKLKHVVAGILSEAGEAAEQAIVFHQYGKFLSGKSNEPIVDHHVLRAFAVYKFRDAGESVMHYKKMNVVSVKEIELIERYKQWLAEELNYELRQVPDYIYHVDKVLFALGKYIKHLNRSKEKLSREV